MSLYENFSFKLFIIHLIPKPDILIYKDSFTQRILYAQSIVKPLKPHILFSSLKVERVILFWKVIFFLLILIPKLNKVAHQKSNFLVKKSSKYKIKKIPSLSKVHILKPFYLKFFECRQEFLVWNIDFWICLRRNYFTIKILLVWLWKMINGIWERQISASN
mgnify:CR=1 FL=1